MSMNVQLVRHFVMCLDAAASTSSSTCCGSPGCGAPRQAVAQLHTSVQPEPRLHNHAGFDDHGNLRPSGQRHTAAGDGRSSVRRSGAPVHRAIRCARARPTGLQAARAGSVGGVPATAFKRLATESLVVMPLDVSGRSSAKPGSTDERESLSLEHP
jgi:hypothetical protein